MKTRPKNYKPHRQRVPTQLVLQPRDIEILQAIYTNRFLTRDLLALLFPPTAESWGRKPSDPQRGHYLYRRLAKLFHAGYLDRIRTVIGGELIYAVSTAGLTLLREDQPELPLPIRADNIRLSHQYVHHALMISQLRVSLIVACRELPHIRLEKFERESMELKASWRSKGATVYVNPDAFFILRHTNRADRNQLEAYFVECDRGTMPIQRAGKGTSFVAKFQRYCEMHKRDEQRQFGVPAFKMLTVTTSKDRAGRILKYAALDDSIPNDQRSLFYFTTDDAFSTHPRNIFARIWRRADDPRKENASAIVDSPPPKLEASESATPKTRLERRTAAG